MRRSSAFFVSLAVLFAAGAARAADETFVCQGDAGASPLVLKVEGGLSAPTGATYQWDRSAPIPTRLTGLLGSTLQFHGVAPGADGVGVADVALNRETLALSVKTRTVGADGTRSATLEGACKRSS